jgi:hypothetical protein
MVAILLDPKKEKLPLTEELSDVINYHRYMSISLPALNMIYEASSLEISTSIFSPKIKDANKILKVPKDKKTVLIVGFGYEKEGVYIKGKHLKKDVIFYEYFGNLEK